MMRDTRRSEDYFSELLADLDEAIDATQTALDDGDFPLPAEQVDTGQQLYQLSIMRAVAHYSAGTQKATLKPIVEAILPLRQQLNHIADTLPPEHQVYRRPFEELGLQGKACGSENVNRYIYVLWWLSLLVACDVDNAHIQAALKIIGNSGQDALLDAIAITLGDRDRKQASSLLYPERYQPLYEALKSLLNSEYLYCAHSLQPGMTITRMPTGTKAMYVSVNLNTPIIIPAIGVWNPY